MRQLLSLIFCCFFVAGCATTKYMPANDLGKGPSRTYSYPYEKVFDAAIEAVRAQSVQIREKNKSTGWIVGYQPPTFWTDSQFVSVYVQPMGSSRSRVEVLTGKAVMLEVIVKRVVEPIFEAISKELEAESVPDA